LFVQAREVLGHQAPVGLGVEVRLDDLRGRGDRQLHRFTPQREERLLFLGVDVLAGADEQRLVLLARLGEQHLSFLLRYHLRLRDDVLRFGAGRRDRLPVLLEQALRFGVGPLRLLELLLDSALALFHRLEDRRPSEAPQQHEQDPEDDQGPEDQACVDGEGRETPFPTMRAFLQHQRQQRHQRTLNISANTSAARVAPSMSAAVRIIAPRMSAEASGCRAIASTAWPPIRPMPSPAPMMARPSPMPAPSRALVFLATSWADCIAW